jgi:HSP20 family molecular chaperone IbpA
MSTTNKSERANQWVVPRLDVYENENEYLLDADVPGARAEQIEIGVDKGVLTLASRGVAPEWDYRRELRLGDEVDAEHIVATLEAGVLRLHLPKRAELRPRKIAVAVG